MRGGLFVGQCRQKGRFFCRHSQMLGDGAVAGGYLSILLQFALNFIYRVIRLIVFFFRIISIAAFQLLNKASETNWTECFCQDLHSCYTEFCRVININVNHLQSPLQDKLLDSLRGLVVAACCTHVLIYRPLKEKRLRFRILRWLCADCPSGVWMFCCIILSLGF